MSGMVRSAGASTSTVSAAAPLGYLAASDAKYGGLSTAVGADNGPALQAVFDEAEAVRVAGSLPLGPAVKLPFGRFRVSTPLTWGQFDVIADSQRATEIIWTGSTSATAVTSPGGLTGKKWVDTNFRSTGVTGATKPACWIDASAGLADQFGQLVRCSFHDISSNTGAAVKLGQIVNAHFRDMRFDVGHGWCIQAIHGGGPGRAFDLQGFTLDTISAAGAGTFKGLVNVVYTTSSCDTTVHISDARIESGSGDWATDSALVVLSEQTSGVIGLRPAFVHLHDLNVQLQTQTQVSIVKQETTSTSIGSQVVIDSCSFGGVTNTLGGTWVSTVPIPAMPSSGQVMRWSLGRSASGATATHHTLMRDLALGAEDLTLARDRANVLALGADDALKTGHAATGSLPAAATVGQGGQSYDDTLKKPAWSNGTSWRYPVMADEGGSGGTVAVGAPYRANAWIHPPVGTTTLALTLNQVRYIPYVVPATDVLKAIAIEVTTAATTSSGGILRCNLYADDGSGYPTGSPLTTDVTVSSETTGTKTLTISQSVTAGRVHLAVVAQVATCTVRACSGINPWAVASGYGVNTSGLIGPSESATLGAASVSSSGQVPFAALQMT